MSTVRRRVLRPARQHVSADEQQVRRQRQSQKRRDQLEKERAAFDRWMARLRRAFNAVEKQRQRIARLERQLSASPDA